MNYSNNNLNENNLFYDLKLIFSNPQKYIKKPNFKKVKNFFMLQRFFSINYPIQANYFNNININQGEVLNYWCISLSKIYKTVPNWIFMVLKNTKKEKNNKIEENKLNKISNEIKEYYCKINNLNKEDLNNLYNFYGDEFINELKKYENY